MDISEDTSSTSTHPPSTATSTTTPTAPATSTTHTVSNPTMTGEALTAETPTSTSSSTAPATSVIAPVPTASAKTTSIPTPIAANPSSETTTAIAKTYEAGVAPIKPEYPIFRSGPLAGSSRSAPAPNDDEAEVGTSHASHLNVAQEGTEETQTPQGGADRRARSRPSQKENGYKTKAEKKAFKGQNKSRHFSKTTDSLDLCWRIANGAGCTLPASECRYTHDVGEYLRVKERDWKVPTVRELDGTRVGVLGRGEVRGEMGGGGGGGMEKRDGGMDGKETGERKEKKKAEEQYILIKSDTPFFEDDEEGGRHIREGNVALLVAEPEQDEPESVATRMDDNAGAGDTIRTADSDAIVKERGLAGFECIDPTTTCPTYETFGECRFGFKCRFLGGHVRVVPSASSGPTPSTLTSPTVIETAHTHAPAPSSDGVPLELLTNPSLTEKTKLSQTAHEMNRIEPGVLKALKGRKYPLPKTDEYLSSIGLETMGQQQASWEAKQSQKHQKHNRSTGEDRAKNRLRNRVRVKKDKDGDVVFEEGEQEEQDGMDEAKDGEGEKEKEKDGDVQMSAPSATSADPPAHVPTVPHPGSEASAALTTEDLIAKRTSVPVPGFVPVPVPVPVPQRDSDPELKVKDVKMSDDSDLKARIRPREKKRLLWDGLNYLAPLTTVGNLPFRRLCTYLGADITCGEMSLTHPLLSGQPHEWSLLRRHPSEKIFGVQVAGSRPGVLVPVGEVVGREFGGGGGGGWGARGGGGGGYGGVDFVDVNCGCPIDMVFNSGSGSALLDTPSKLSRILRGMSYTLGDIPLTIKVRTGVKEGKNTVHRMLPRLVGGERVDGGAGAGGERGGEEGPSGIGCVSIHGRTRQQRYTKSADWEYIKLCVEKVREREEEEDLSPIPIFGNGDIFSPSTARSLLTSTGVSGLMVGRGALIKPWIFSELSAFGGTGMGGGGAQPRLNDESVRAMRGTKGMEGVIDRLGLGLELTDSLGGSSGGTSPTYATGDYDISSRERLSLIRLYALFALDHFGSDTPGIQKARRYLCEMLSFMWRYIPVGILERVPVGINERGGVFRGRDELETLLASSDCRDWVRISEMFLGKAPESWRFVPKHKSNAYGSEESQG